MEVISRETIKPSTPTPPHLKIFPLSILDHNFRNAYTPLLLFYENKAFQIDNHIHNDDDDTFTSTLAKVRDQRSKILKESLSQLLAIYYPFAGRLMRDNPYSIECNDQGVTFIITHFNHFNLSHFLQNPTQDSIINPLFADQLCWNYAVDVVNESFLAIQVNHFACGGIAIAVSMSHKIGDMFALSNFVKDWGIITQKSILDYSSNTQQQAQEEEALILPKFNGASLFPCGDFPIPKHDDSFRVNEIQRQLKRRFVFESSKIRSLKEMVESQRVHDQQNHHHHPTRVQVVSALIYKCFVSALRSSVHHVNDNNPNINVTMSFRFSVNLRTRVLMSLPPPDKSIGNASLDFLVCTTNEEEGELELHELVRKIPQRLNEIRDTLAKDIERKDMSYFREHIMKNRTNSVITSSENDEYDNNNLVFFNILITSWCRFPMYQTDFGWGKPIWVTTVGHRSRKNVAILMDTRDGEGIEAYVNMEEEAMALFERNEELLQFASLNPSVG